MSNIAELEAKVARLKELLDLSESEYKSMVNCGGEPCLSLSHGFGYCSNHKDTLWADEKQRADRLATELGDEKLERDLLKLRNQRLAALVLELESSLQKAVTYVHAKTCKTIRDPTTGSALGCSCDVAGPIRREGLKVIAKVEAARKDGFDLNV